MDELLFASAVEQAALVRSGEVSARELVEASLAAIERIDPEVNAFVALCPERALAEADRVRPGDPRPFCGVPFAVKDFLTATEGVPTSEGSSAFGDWVADHDSAHVRRLREAAAILVGKTNTPELAMRPVTESQRFGPTRNPWDLRLSPGGSSGGSAAAVAAGMVALADGSDLGGSIRIPAACCGLVGLKPSRGRVSIGPDLGDVGTGHVNDGVLTRTVLDTAVALDVIAGRELGDQHCASPPGVPFADTVRRRPGRLSIRLALAAPLGVPIDPQPLTAACNAADVLADLGHHVHEGTPDWHDETFPSSWETFIGAVVQHLVRVIERLHGRPVDAARLEPSTRAWAIERPRITAVDYLQAVESLRALTRRILRSWGDDEVLLTPTLTRLPAQVGDIAPRAGVSDDAVRFSALVRPWNMTGQPAISLPLYETHDGVPVGVQLVGPPGRDDLLLALAAELEDAVGFRPRHPPHEAPRGWVHAGSEPASARHRLGLNARVSAVPLAGHVARHPKSGGSGEPGDEADCAAVAERVGDGAGDQGADRVARVAPEAIHADDGGARDGGHGVGDRGDQRRIHQRGSEAEHRSRGGSEDEVAVADRQQRERGGRRSMPATISGLRPTESDQCPVAIWVTLQTAG